MGFIGSTLVDRLLQDGHHEVVGYDNFPTGQPGFLVEAQLSPRFHLVRGHTLDLNRLTQAMRGTDCIFHLATNADMRSSTHHPRKNEKCALIQRSQEAS
ncbi:MAG: NAD-dependent epimerase/dehydratase family protein [Candidatus Methylomirabilales bacterium]